MTARSVLGEDVPISGNLDPTVLFGSQEQIEQAVSGVHRQGGRTGQQTLAEFGHGVAQGTPRLLQVVGHRKRYQGKSE
jgi:uroporphyrinogen-III decarboxylase